MARTKTASMPSRSSVWARVKFGVAPGAARTGTLTIDNADMRKQSLNL